MGCVVIVMVVTTITNGDGDIDNDVSSSILTTTFIMGKDRA